MDKETIGLHKLTKGNKAVKMTKDEERWLLSMINGNKPIKMTKEEAKIVDYYLPATAILAMHEATEDNKI